MQQRITLKNKSKRQSSIITAKGKDFTNLKIIANAFNIVFTNIGPNLSETIPQSKKRFENFLNSSLLNSFVLNP